MVLITTYQMVPTLFIEFSPVHQLKTWELIKAVAVQDVAIIRALLLLYFITFLLLYYSLLKDVTY